MSKAPLALVHIFFADIEVDVDACVCAGVVVEVSVGFALFFVREDVHGDGRYCQWRFVSRLIWIVARMRILMLAWISDVYIEVALAVDVAACVNV